MEPWIFLFQNLFHCTALHDIDEVVTLSLKRHRPGSVVDVMFQVCCADGFQFTSHLGTLRWITLNGGPAGRVGWRAVFPIRKHEFAASWRAALKGGLDIRAGRRAAH